MGRDVMGLCSLSLLPRTERQGQGHPHDIMQTFPRSCDHHLTTFISTFLVMTFLVTLKIQN